eukprot:TRINITY_DN17443_c0_g1_i2.p1 TRINITY_DN17443_c0_g1~~TRINITY_DN17443_c0_g1_i2.p1  ORF type:complete len:131 (-),score=30.77 TRINITY_DN17443_c0_g1_i2:6-341(-)
MCIRDRLNITEIERKMENYSLIEGVTSRWLLPGTAKNPDKPGLDINLFAIIGNIEKEKALGLGNNLALPPTKKGEAYILRSALTLLGYSMFKSEFSILLHFQKFYLPCTLR